MALPALKIEWEPPVEQRIAKLEVAVDHLQSDATEIKSDIRRLDSKVDAVKESVSSLSIQTEKSFTAVNASIAALAMNTEKSISELKLTIERSISSQTRWGVGLYIGLVAAILTAFMWIAERLPPH